MLLVIDIGNTNIALGLYRGDQLAEHWRIGTRVHSTSDECAAMLDSLLRLAPHDPEPVSAAIISSVVPPLLPIYQRTCTKLFGCDPIVVGPGLRTGMAIQVDNPREVGADRIVNSVAAYELLGGPAISIDFGTATSFDCISASGAFLGGAIFPGLTVSLEALVERASKLSSVEIERPPAAVGRNTVHSLQSGILFGYAGMVDAIVERLRSEIGAEARVVATGGLAHVIATETQTIRRVEPFLTLRGLRLIWERNHKSTTNSKREEEA
ncbi:MAG: type III pantothenate kinase [Myxococcota bacterium]